MNEDMIHQAFRYFRGSSVYPKLFAEFRAKLESLGRIGGNVNIAGYSAEELETLALFFGGLRKKKVISLAAFDKRLQETKFAGIDLLELLEAYFGEPIRSTKAVRKEQRDKEEAVLRESGVVHPVLSDYFDYLGRRTADSQRIIRLLLSEGFDRNIRLLANAANALPEAYERLPFFSQRVSGDPHTFDLSGMNGKLLVHYLNFRLYGAAHRLPARKK